MPIDPQTQIAALATRYPATIRVFQQLGIDFCCGGKRPLAAACREQGVAVDEVVARLEEALVAAPEKGRDWTTAPLGDLIDHILQRYHARLVDELPRLAQMADKVLRVHGERHPEMLPPLVQTLAEMTNAIDEHLRQEEVVFFPAVRRVEGGDLAGDLELAADGAGLGAPITAMEEEHVVVGRALADLRRLSHDFTPPEDACNTFRGLFHGLQELEADLHEHIHLENNILFPRAAGLRSNCAGAVAAHP